MTASCVHHLFEAQAESQPQAIALRLGERELTYAQLDRAANALAHRCGAAPLEPRTLVGICATRSPRAVIAMLAALKAGAAFLPLDVAGPRRPGIAPRLVLAEPRLTSRASAYGVECVPIPDPWTEAGRENAPPRSGAAGADDWACVLPARAGDAEVRSVALTHSRQRAAIERARTCLDVDRETAFLSLAALDDPTFLLETFVGLAAGARLRFVESPLFLAKAAATERAAMLLANPRSVEDMLDASLLPRDLRALVLLDDVVTPRLHARLRAFAPGTAVYGALGQRETAGWTAGRLLDESCVDLFDESFDPARSALTVLGPDLRAASDASGDVYVTGPAAACVYVDDAGRAASPSPPISTGFAGCRTPDGVRLTGRRGRRVWLRGRYVDPAAIEAALLRQPRIREAAVVVERDVTAYLTSDDEHLAAALAASPPVDAVALDAPIAYVVSRAPLPKAPGGAVDIAALRARPARAASAEPCTATQQTLASIWTQVLSKDAIGLEDNFFDLGANSLEAYLACSSVAKDLGVKLTIVDIYNHPTIRSLAAAIDESNVPSRPHRAADESDRAVR